MDANHARDKAGDLHKHDCVGYVGFWTSSPTIEVSKFLAKPSIDRALISPAAASPELSKPQFWNFLRTGLSEGDGARLMTKLMGPLIRLSYLLRPRHNTFLLYSKSARLISNIREMSLYLYLHIAEFLRFTSFVCARFNQDTFVGDA